MAVMAVRALPRKLCFVTHKHSNEALAKSSKLSRYGIDIHKININTNNNGVSSSSSPSPIRPTHRPRCLSSSSTESESKLEEAELEMEKVELEMEKAGNNMRRIEARVEIETPLEAVWNVLTDYEKLADFIPGLAQSQLLLHSPSYARLFQVGEQKLGFGLKFEARGVVDCYERELVVGVGGSLQRDIEFEMVQGDFEIFQGKWSILQVVDDNDDGSGKRMRTSLSYLVDVKPKMWLPVRLVEARLCNEIKLNLASIRRQALNNMVVYVVQFQCPRTASEHNNRLLLEQLGNIIEVVILKDMRNGLHEGAGFLWKCNEGKGRNFFAACVSMYRVCL